MKTRSLAMTHLVLFAAMLAASAAPAADALFASGIRVGIRSSGELKVATDFPGFEETSSGVKVLTAELPKEAYAAVEKALNTRGAPKKGKAATEIDRLEALQIPLGKAFLTQEDATFEGSTVRRFALIVPAPNFSGYVTVQVPEKSAKEWPEQRVKQLFATVSLRSDVPVSEHLDALPFRLGDLGGFAHVKTLARGTAISLSDSDGDHGLDSVPAIIISIGPGGPTQNDDRRRFAEQLAMSLQGFRDIKITSSEPLRLGGVQGFETRLEAKFGPGDTPVTLVQWLRFGPGAHLRLIGGSSTDKWADVFPRLRTVRDSIEPR